MACGFFIWRMGNLFSIKPHPASAGAPPAGVAVFKLFGSRFFVVPTVADVADVAGVVTVCCLMGWRAHRLPGYP